MEAADTAVLTKFADTLLDPEIVERAIADALGELRPAPMWSTPGAPRFRRSCAGLKDERQRYVDSVAKGRKIGVLVKALRERDLRQHFRTDYRVVKASSGAQALETVTELKHRGSQLALFLVDERMPHMTGTQFLSEAGDVDRPEELVLKPLYSFAGLGVIVGPTREQIAAVPGALRADLSARVSPRRRRLGRATRCRSAMIAAMVFTLTFQPAARTSSVMRGEPYVPRCRPNRAPTSAVNPCRRARRSEVSPWRHL